MNSAPEIDPADHMLKLYHVFKYDLYSHIFDLK